VSETRSEERQSGAQREPREARLRRRSNRERPLLIVNTGHGKGKSTASFGVMLRGWARGYKIGVYQFVKSGGPGQHRLVQAGRRLDVDLQRPRRERGSRPRGLGRGQTAHRR